MIEEVGPTADSLWSVNIIPNAVITIPMVSSLLASFDNFMVTTRWYKGESLEPYSFNVKIAKFKHHYILVN